MFGRFLNAKCVKRVRIESFSGPYFPAFGLNTERYYVSLGIQFEFWESKDQKNSAYGHFLLSDNSE